MPIYTKFGDQGKTSLFGGDVVQKDDLRVDAYGSVDELNAVLGVVLSLSEDAPLNKLLLSIQSDLFSIGAQLASKTPSKTLSPRSTINLNRVSELEQEIDRMELELPPLRNFILPGGNKVAAMLHLARTICRRAERRVVALSQKEKVNPTIIVYINRLSDLLFVQARFVNYKKKVTETIWKGK